MADLGSVQRGWEGAAWLTVAKRGGPSHGQPRGSFDRALGYRFSGSKRLGGIPAAERGGPYRQGG